MSDVENIIEMMVAQVLNDVNEVLKQKAFPPDVARDVFYDAKLAGMMVDLWEWRNKTCSDKTPKATENDKLYAVATALRVMQIARPKLNAMLDSHFAGVEKVGNQ